MVKSIIKEIIIMLLLLIAIVLALGVLFYDYIPTNKTIPSVGDYQTSETIKTELAEQITEEEEVIVTYEISSSDLSTYEKTNDYTKGKVNPFSTYEITPEGEEEETENTNNLGGSSALEAGSTNSNSTTFYSNTGTK